MIHWRSPQRGTTSFNLIEQAFVSPLQSVRPARGGGGQSIQSLSSAEMHWRFAHRGKDHSVSLNNLTTYLSTRYDQLGAMEDLSESFILGRDILALCPPGHPGRSTLFLDNLAVRLSTRYNQLGEMEDLNEAIVLGREALALCSPRHLDPTSLNNLATYLSSRYNQLEGMEDLSEAIVLGRDTLTLFPLGHPNRSMSLNNLAVRLSARYKLLGAIEDIDEATVLGREALALCPPGHPGRSLSLDNHAVRLSTRYNQLGEMKDLNEAIVHSTSFTSTSHCSQEPRIVACSGRVLSLSSQRLSYRCDLAFRTRSWPLLEPAHSPMSPA